MSACESNSCGLSIFLKAPRPGFVKTRIAAELGTAKAAEIYGSLVDELVKNLSSLKRVELRHSPDDAHFEISHWLKPGWTSCPQGGGDLGVRMQSAFADAFEQGSTRWVLIGSDCPDVHPQDIRKAFEVLETHDVVVGPAYDGGYWLIGLRQQAPDLFLNMTWSTDSVLKETLDRCNTLGLTVALLDMKHDIDSAMDWKKRTAVA